jgi:broad specificity polyphosphatase/5'/3'-nucleotidase SurE
MAFPRRARLGPGRYFTRRLARQILSEGLPGDVAVININVPDRATPKTEVRRTVRSRRRYYVYLPPGTRALAEPVRLQIRTVVKPELLEPDSDIRAVACDGVVSVTPLTWSMTARTDWQPATDGWLPGPPASTPSSPRPGSPPNPNRHRSQTPAFQAL